LAETVLVDKNLTLDSQYDLLFRQLKSLLDRNDNWLSNLSNFAAALKQTFEKINWVGFYLFDGKTLYLGPFQGKLACTKIELGKGVCGTSAKTLETIVVPDVNKFPGHIFCDVDSKSEIVIPLIKDNKLFGVLDIDSSSFNSFNEIDKKYLEEICKFLTKEIL
jgi:L-methionine (R)-S-oxide reductase